MIKNTNMLEEIKQDSVEYTPETLEKYNIQKDTVAHIKKQCDKKFNST